MRIETLDHVALWVGDRDGMAEFLCTGLGMHVIQRTADFTLVGWDARGGKLTLFAADGPREPGALDRIVLRPPDLERALEAVPQVDRTASGEYRFAAPEALPLSLVGGEGPPDIARLVLRLSEPRDAFDRFQALGFQVEGPLLRAGKGLLELSAEEPPPAERPFLNHVGLLVESADDHIREAKERAFEIADIVDAQNTRALFVWGPERIKLEYVEHKDSFALT
jgi:catechol 2,3-dioxygenase-like lactoylglutathione lyase family enzyme